MMNCFFVDENQEFYRFSYIFQDKPDNTNNVIFDSISRKYRTRSNSTDNIDYTITSREKIHKCNKN